MKTFTKIMVFVVTISIATIAWADPIDLPLKWSQPIVEWPDMPGVYYGWDEVSIDPEPIVADDWECRTDLPVIGIHWWGSYHGWLQKTPPPAPFFAPNAFLIQFWTNVPVDDPTNTYGFSYPGDPIHTIYCDVYDEEFVGYDMDPETLVFTDATFQYSQIFPESEWFYQDITGAEPGIYWVSIQAIYDVGIPDPYPWGWKTRPWYFEDDAVRSSMLFPVGWEPIERLGESWDMAFELYTIPEPAFLTVLGIVAFFARRKK